MTKDISFSEESSCDHSSKLVRTSKGKHSDAYIQERLLLGDFQIMVALIRNLQTRTILNLPVLLQNSNTLLEILRISHFDVNLVFVGKGFIKSLNMRYRRRNVTTDVLAFPYLEVRLGLLRIKMQIAG